MERAETLAEEGGWTVIMQGHESPLVDVKLLQTIVSVPEVKTDSISSVLACEDLDKDKRLKRGKCPLDIVRKRASWSGKYRTRYMIHCQFCGKDSFKDYYKTKFCSPKCSWDYMMAQKAKNSKEGNCPICGEHALLYRVAKGVACCSVRCQKTCLARLDGRHAGDASAKTKIIKREDKCVRCGKEFIRKSHIQLYCSKRCAWKSHHVNKRRGILIEQRKQNRMIWEKQIGKCALCGTFYEDIKTQNELGLKRKNGVVKFNVDHIVPASSGGGSELGNRRNICWLCNYIRSSLDQKLDYLVAAAGKAFWEAVKQLPPEIMLQQADFQWNFQGQKTVVPRVETELESNIKDGVNQHV